MNDFEEKQEADALNDAPVEPPSELETHRSVNASRFAWGVAALGFSAWCAWDGVWLCFGASLVLGAALLVLAFGTVSVKPEA